MRRLLAILWLSHFCVFLVGCSSTTDEEDEAYFNPRVPAAAYVADHFIIHADLPIHPEWKPVDFYFKSCNEMGLGDHFKKTSYDCTYP